MPAPQPPKHDPSEPPREPPADIGAAQDPEHQEAGSFVCRLLRLQCMASVHDVAAYVLGKLGPMAPTKFQKLVYYCQAWNLAWRGVPLYDARIEAWANGPVVRELYRLHRLEPGVYDWPKGNPENLSPEDRSTIDAVLDYYGDKSAFWLSELTHREAPWQEAREGIPANARSEREITTDSMKRYYSAVAQG